MKLVDNPAGIILVTIFSGEGDTPSPQVNKDDNALPAVNVERPEEPTEQEDVDEDQDMGEVDHDPTCSEGTIEYRIKNFSKITGKILSHPPVYIRDLPWYLMDDLRGPVSFTFFFIYT